MHIGSIHTHPDARIQNKQNERARERTKRERQRENKTRTRGKGEQRKIGTRTSTDMKCELTIISTRRHLRTTVYLRVDLYIYTLTQNMCIHNYIFYVCVCGFSLRGSAISERIQVDGSIDSAIDKPQCRSSPLTHKHGYTVRDRVKLSGACTRGHTLDPYLDGCCLC